MKLCRVQGVVLRFLFHFRHSFDRWVDGFYWPALDLILWGLTSFYFTASGNSPSSVTVSIVSAIIFWIVVYRGQYEVSGNLLEDVWNKNLVNLFVSPLKFSEWIVSFVAMGVIKTALSFSSAAILAFLFYRINIFLFSFHLIPFVILLIMTGWWIGFFVSGLILRYGTRVQAFAWSLVWAISPFAALYYPVSILPSWAQTVARFVPISYIFEGMREVIATGTVTFGNLWFSFFLSAVYLIAATIFLERSFRSVLRKGLVKVH